MASVNDCLSSPSNGEPYQGQYGLFPGIYGKGLDKAKALLPGGKMETTLMVNISVTRPGLPVSSREGAETP